MGGMKFKKKSQEDDSNGYFEKMRQEKEEKKKRIEEKKQMIAKKRAKYQRVKLNRRLDHELNPEELKERLERRELIGKEV